MNILIWNNHKQWLEHIKDILCNLWGDRIVSELRTKEIVPMIGQSDWFISILNHLKAPSTSPLSDFAKEIQVYWSHIRVYHACRTLNVEDYYRKGIVAPSVEILDEYVKTMLSQYIDPDILSTAMWHMHRYYDKADEKVFVAIDEKHLQSFCGHHLLYGSEYFLCCAMLVGAVTYTLNNILDTIKNSTCTVPTVFISNIPIECIPYDVVLEIAAIILAEGCRMLINPAYIPPSRRLGFGISGKIHPDWIIGHTHPKIDIHVNIPPTWMDVAEYRSLSEYSLSKVQRHPNESKN